MSNNCSLIDRQVFRSDYPESLYLRMHFQCLEVMLPKTMTMNFPHYRIATNQGRSQYEANRGTCPGKKKSHYFTLDFRAILHQKVFFPKRTLHIQRLSTTKPPCFHTLYCQLVFFVQYFCHVTANF